MLRARLVVAMVSVGLFLSPVSAYAQTPTGLLGQMYNLFVQNVVLAKTPAGVGIVAHTPVFLTDPTVTSATTLINQVSQQIGSQVSIFPLGSSSAGFTYAYDSTLGTFSRTTDTFGPAFTERAVTGGKGKLSFGMNYVHSSYSTLDGKDLQGGDIKFLLFHQHLTPPSFVEGDVIQAALHMKLTSDTTAFLVNYGVMDRLDVGLAVPIVRVNMNLTYHAAILDFATHAVSPNTHTFANGSKAAEFNSQGSASGVGDVVVRAKYNFLQRGPAAVAGGLDLHLKTGDSQNMLGSGATQTQLFFIASSVLANKVSPHVNLGYTASSGGVGDQFNYAGGIEYGATPRVTVVGDLVGRTIRSALRLNDVSLPHSFQQGPTAPTETTTLQAVSVSTGNLPSALGAAGVKLNPWNNLLISAHVLFPLNNAGLVSHITPVIGFDYAF